MPRLRGTGDAGGGGGGLEGVCGRFGRWSGDGLAAIETFYARGEYLGPLRKALVNLKYGNGRYLAPALAGRLAKGDFAEAVLVSVLLHAKRQREWGYNQSLLIARELGRELGVGVLEGGLRRVK